MRGAGCALSGLLALFLVFDTTIKLIPIEPVLQTMRMLGYPDTVEFARFLSIMTLVCLALYLYPRTAILGAILMTEMLGGAIAAHLCAGSPLYSHTLFGVYLGILAWSGLYLRDPGLRALIPFRR